MIMAGWFITCLHSNKSTMIAIPAQGPIKRVLVKYGKQEVGAASPGPAWYHCRTHDSAMGIFNPAPISKMEVPGTT